MQETRKQPIMRHDQSIICILRKKAIVAIKSFFKRIQISKLHFNCFFFHKKILLLKICGKTIHTN